MDCGNRMRSYQQLTEVEKTGAILLEVGDILDRLSSEDDVSTVGIPAYLVNIWDAMVFTPPDNLIKRDAMLRQLFGIIKAQAVYTASTSKYPPYIDLYQMAANPLNGRRKAL